MFDRVLGDLRNTAVGIGLTAVVVGTAIAVAFW